MQSLSFIRPCLIAALWCLKPSDAFAHESEQRAEFFLRPTAGMGVGHSFETHPLFAGKAHGGLQAMMLVSDRGFFDGAIKQRIGVQSSYHDISLFDDDFPQALPQRFVSFGFLFEHIVWDNITIALSTSAFVPVGFEPGTYPFAITWQPGWEPQWKSFVRPFVGYRSDWIFASKLISVSTIVVGVTFAFAYL